MALKNITVVVTKIYYDEYDDEKETEDEATKRILKDSSDCDDEIIESTSEYQI